MEAVRRNAPVVPTGKDQEARSGEGPQQAEGHDRRAAKGQDANLEQLARPAVDEGRLQDVMGERVRQAEDRGRDVPRLRGTFITERRREGSTTEQIASITGHSIAEVGRVLEKHYLATDQQTSDAVILRMEKNIT
nr:hypothetical protein [Ensifer sesbaniae]